MNEINIAGRKIGPDYKPIIICEIGINHNGSLAIAKKMVDAAKKSGAEIIKHQTHIAEDEMSDEAKTIKPGNSNKPIFNIIKDCSLNESDELELKKYVEKNKMIFLSTPFSKKAVDRLIKFKVSAFKIGSGEFNNLPLIEYIASFKKPMILSTGMNNIPQIKETINILNSKKISFALLHTTNLYPTPHNLVRLGALKEMIKNFPKIVFGLSDHTTDNYASYFALGMGASIIERHFTDRKTRGGPDISCSMSPNDLSQLIQAANLFHSMKGGKKDISKNEKVTARFAFASVISTKKIYKGTKLNKKNLWVKRPGNGEFKAKDLKKLFGKIAKQNIEKGVQIKKKYIK